MRVKKRSGADFVGGTWTSPAGRHIRCQFCQRLWTIPRVNGAWMVLKKALRVHIEEHHAEKLEVAVAP